MHKVSFRTAKGASITAAFLMASCGLALAGPGGGSHGGGFGGGSGGGFHGGSFGHPTFASHQSMVRPSSGVSHTAMRHSSHVSSHARLASSHHTRLASSHHTHLASNGSPAGFSHGNASWKKNGGTPPGWSHGKKTGWGCTPGSSGCMPPGLAKKQAGGIQPASHSPTASHSQMTPQLASRTPVSHSGNTPQPASHVPTPSSASLKPTPISHSPTPSQSNGAPQ
jgi:hypothetical protein